MIGEHQRIVLTMLRCMRTTMSLDDDVAAELQRRQRDNDATWKETVNEVLRAGLRAVARDTADDETRSTTESVSLGRPRMDVADVHGVLAAIEGDERS